MFEITSEADGSFNLVRDGKHVGNFKSAQDAVDAQAIAESNPPQPIPSPFKAKTIANVSTFKLASIFVVDLLFTDGTHHFIKTKQGLVEHGGTADWGTGVERE